jgi:hypothetical protein
MTQFMQQGREQDQPGNNKDPRDYLRAAAVHFNQQQKEQQNDKREVDADFSSARPQRKD